MFPLRAQSDGEQAQHHSGGLMHLGWNPPKGNAAALGDGETGGGQGSKRLSVCDRTWLLSNNQSCFIKVSFTLTARRLPFGFLLPAERSFVQNFAASVTTVYLLRNQ